MKNTESSVVVANVSNNNVKPEFDQAELRQTTTTSYPNKKIGQTFVGEDQFNLPSTDFTGTKVAWVNVPKGYTIEQAITDLAKYPNARLQKVLSLEPILSDDDKWAISNIADVTEETFANRQLVRNQAGEVVLFNGKKQYKKIIFSATGAEDIDLRSVAAPHNVEKLQVAEPVSVEETVTA
jgi:hypothetical protein